MGSTGVVESNSLVDAMQVLIWTWTWTRTWTLDLNLDLDLDLDLHFGLGLGALHGDCDFARCFQRNCLFVVAPHVQRIIAAAYLHARTTCSLHRPFFFFFGVTDLQYQAFGEGGVGSTWHCFEVGD
jgi:hypothetical protein